MAEDSEERFFAKVELVIAPLLADGSLAAIGREAVKDVRNTFHEVFWGRSEHAGEIGSPLYPLYTDLNEAKEHWQEVMTPSELARDDRPYSPNAEQSHDQSRGHSH